MKERPTLLRIKQAKLVQKCNTFSSSPRTFPAVGVIFSEGRIIDGRVRIRKREAWTLFKDIKKRSVEGESKKSLQAQILAINEKSAIFAQSS